MNCSGRPVTFAQFGTDLSAHQIWSQPNLPASPQQCRSMWKGRFQGRGALVCQRASIQGSSGGKQQSKKDTLLPWRATRLGNCRVGEGTSKVDSASEAGQPREVRGLPKLDLSTMVSTCGIEPYLNKVIERKVGRGDPVRRDLREEGSSKLGVRSKGHPEELRIHLLSSVSLLNNLQHKKHRNPLAQMIFWHSLFQAFEAAQWPASLFLQRGARPTKPAGGWERGGWVRWAFFRLLASCQPSALGIPGQSLPWRTWW